MVQKRPIRGARAGDCGAMNVELTSEEINIIKVLCMGEGFSEKDTETLALLFDKLESIKPTYHPTPADIWAAIQDASK